MYFLFVWFIYFICRRINVKKIKYSPIFTLQVQGCKKIIRYPKKDKYKSTFLLSPLKGSMTIEAAMVLSIFIFAITYFSSFFVLLNYQNIMQCSVINASKSISRYSYVLDRINEFTQSEQKKIELDFDKEILISGIDTGYAWKKILTNEVKEYSKKAGIINGLNGIAITSSKINNEGGINDLKVVYKIKMGNILTLNYNFRLANRCYFREWIGESISKQITHNKQIVYITKTGDVYHTNRECSYINLTVVTARYSDISCLRNSYGDKFYKCEKCVKQNINSNDIIYITLCGSSYHTNKNCGAIKRDVLEIDISQIGNRKLCSRCNKSEKNEIR